MLSNLKLEPLKARLAFANLKELDNGYTSSDINGQEMLEAAEEIIESARQYVGGRIIYLDCTKDLISLYEKNGYELVIDTPFAGDYYKMFKSLPDIE